MNLFFQIAPTWIELVSLAFCMGTLVCRSVFFRSSPAEGFADRDQVLGRLWACFFGSLAFIMAGSAADLLLRSAEMSGKPVGAVLPLLPEVILKTHYGRVWLVRMAGLAAMLILSAAGKRRRDSNVCLNILLAAAAGIALTVSATGHASDAGDFTTAEIVDWLHLLAALIWGGGLFVLSLVVLPPLVQSDDHDKAAGALAGTTVGFSGVAGKAAGVLVLTSLYNAWLYIGSMKALEESPYGRTIIAKIALFGALLLIAAINRYVNVPRLLTWAGRAAPQKNRMGRILARLVPFKSNYEKDHRSTKQFFLRTVRLEAVLVLGILTCVAMLRHEVPARHYEHLGHEGNEHTSHLRQVSVGPDVSIHLETSPAEIVAGTRVAMTVFLQDQKSRPLNRMLVHHESILHTIIISTDLSIFAHIHPEDLGPVTDDMTRRARFPLQFTFPKAGVYLIGLDFATEDGLIGKSLILKVGGRPEMAEQRIDLSRKKNVGPYRVTIRPSPGTVMAGSETTLRFVIEKHGKPVRELQPYLGAAMHIAVVRSDLTEFMHIHGYPPGDVNVRLGHGNVRQSERYGPELDADMVFPVPGIYAVFCQVKHEGNVILFSFMIRVQDAGMKSQER